MPSILQVILVAVVVAIFIFSTLSLGLPVSYVLHYERVITECRNSNSSYRTLETGLFIATALMQIIAYWDFGLFFIVAKL